MPTRVLLIEDDPDCAETLQLMLGVPTTVEQTIDCATCEFCVIHVTTLNAAIEVLRHNKIDVMLVDLYLPDAEGETTINLLEEAAPDVPIVVNSGDEDLELVERLLRRGICDYLLKGTYSSGEMLKQKIFDAIEKKTAFREKDQHEVEATERLNVRSRRQFQATVTHPSGVSFPSFWRDESSGYSFR